MTNDYLNMNQEEKLMDYLYGEMTASEKQAFEKELANNPTLKAALAELQGSRAFLADLPDVQPTTKVVTLKPKKANWRKWAIPLSMAASFLLLLKMVDFQAVKTKDGFNFSFGAAQQIVEKQPITTPNYVTVSEVQELMESRDAAYRKALLARDSVWQARLTRQEQALQKNIGQQMTSYQNKQQKDYQTFVNNFQQEELPELANLMQNLLNEHQAETKLMFGEAWTNWQDTRTQDLKTIGSEFVNVYQNQTETDALLLNVINSGDD